MRLGNLNDSSVSYFVHSKWSCLDYSAVVGTVKTKCRSLIVIVNGSNLHLKCVRGLKRKRTKLSVTREDMN